MSTGGVEEEQWADVDHEQVFLTELGEIPLNS